MIYLPKHSIASTMNCMYSSRYLRRMVECLFVLATLLCLFEYAHCANVEYVCRMQDGDQFANPFHANGGKDCANTNATCVKSWTHDCSGCKCNSGTETYRADIMNCVSTKVLADFTGCGGKGIRDDDPQLTDKTLPTLDFTKSGTKNIRGLLRIHHGIPVNDITCKIKNNTSFLSDDGNWIALPNMSNILTITPNEGRDTDPAHLTMEWEEVNGFLSGLLLKLQISCHTKTDPPENGCFVFKIKDCKNYDPSSKIISSTKAPTIHTAKEVNRETTKSEKPPTMVSTTVVNSTKESVVNKNYTYSVSMPVIIGISAGVGLVILLIIILAVCFVRHRIRKHEKEKPSIANPDAPIKVHFTAETRFSLIQEAAPVNTDDEDYTSLKEDRESYEPYYSLKKDDVDLNVIDTILRDAVSMECMSPSAEPRYNCHLTKDDAIVIESSRPRSPKQPNYHVLEEPGDDIDPDYEEVDDDDDIMTSQRLLPTKPPLPDHEYHQLEPPLSRLHSDC
ncbi:uncharacterized protein LOC114542169 [Dendronephthya gigantea]|uniref:uncharacterized protein LOC114542169 n=1 Tax=Dendronephthya gigantea TaxID=151771 RepID=UPI001068F288|nr:uncharacterized protein LOC114542169 [Dendronephthya gigantea]